MPAAAATGLGPVGQGDQAAAAADGPGAANGGAARPAGVAQHQVPQWQTIGGLGTKLYWPRV